MIRLLRFLKHYIPQCILAPLFKMLEASFELFVPLVMASVMDRGICMQDTEHLRNMALVLIGLAVIGLVCSITAQYFAAKAAVGFAKETRHALFEHIQSLSFEDLDGLGVSTLITRMTGDMNQVQNGINMVLRLFLRSPFIVIGAMVMAFHIDSKAALIFVVVIPLLFVIIFGIILITIPRFTKIQASLDRLLTVTRENLTGVRVIRAFGREEAEIGEFDEKNDYLTKLQLITGRIDAVMNPVTFIIINAAIILLLYVGAQKVDLGDLTRGEVVALVNYMNQILVELVKFANLIITVTKAYACGNRIEEAFAVVPSQHFPESTSEEREDTSDLVTFDHVSFTYAGSSEPALRNIDFSVKPGETVGIIGGTGSGKSTLVSLIGRFYDASEGRVMVDGRNVTAYAKGDLRERIGMVSQKAVLFRGTIRENLLWGNPDATEEDLRVAVVDSRSEDVIAKKAEGLEAKVEAGGRNFSGGQRQRLTIARALVRRPEILILDDSSSALDYATEEKLRTCIRELPYHPTVFIVSQRTSSIAHADRILVLDDGNLVGVGKHEELLASCEIYREIYDSQVKEDAS